MRYAALLLIFASFLVGADVRWKDPKEAPGWSIPLTKAWEESYGKRAPKPGTVEQAERQAEWNAAFEEAFAKWAKTASSVKLPKDSTADTRDLNEFLYNLAQYQKKKNYRDMDSYRRADRIFMLYAQRMNDPTALYFLYVPENRTKFGYVTSDSPVARQ